MSLGDKITGDFYWIDNSLTFTMQEYIEYNGVKYVLVNPPAIQREGHVSDNGDLKGMTKYSLTFYHPMYMLGNLPFTDVAVSSDETQYLSDSKTFSWVGKLPDLILKLNKNLQATEWVVVFNGNQEAQEKANVLSDVIPFDNAMISDVLKTAYDTWKLPFVADSLHQGEFSDGQGHDYYDLGKRFVVVFGTPSNHIYELDGQGQPTSTEFVFKFGQGVGLKNDSRTPKNNKIITRLAGYGSTDNIPYGYPQVRWYGSASHEGFTYGNHAGVYTNVTIGGHTFAKVVSYPIYKGILGGQYVDLIKHPFTREYLMPSTYSATLFNKVSLYNSDGTVNTNYNPDIALIDYIDADDPSVYPNPINPNAPSYEIHQFEKVKPELGEMSIVSAIPYDYESQISYKTFPIFKTQMQIRIAGAFNQMEADALQELLDRIEAEQFAGAAEDKSAVYSYKYEFSHDNNFYFVTYESTGTNFGDTVLLPSKNVPSYEWNDTMDDDGEYEQSYFKMILPALGFDMYACAAITQSMSVNMRSGSCIGCTFEVGVDWEDYKKNFYDANGDFDPVIGEGHPRNGDKYPNSTSTSITIIVKKEISTFGRLMPNIYQQPTNGDKFVILGISLPQSYIANAETLLSNNMSQYLLENNVYYHEYPLKFDEYFLAQYVGILQQMRNNTIVKFQYGALVTPLALYIKQMTVKFGDKPLPEYNITLTDDVEVVLNQIGQVTEDVSRIRVQLSELTKYYGESVINEISNKLSRVSDDIALGRITFQQGINVIADAIFSGNLQSSDFVSGMYTGKGWKIDPLGNAELESLKVRSVLEVIELLINRVQAQEGDTMYSDNDQIEQVTTEVVNGVTYYTLDLKEKWDGYFTCQKRGNIVKGIINTLAAKEAGVSDEESTSVEEDGQNKYYTSWMRVVEAYGDEVSTLTKNQIKVVLYGDSDVPANKNFAPCELMTIARWGCLDAAEIYTGAGHPTEAEIADVKKRQQLFYVSTSEGRIVKLTHVNTPKLRSTNYGTTLGTLPEFIQDWSIASRLIDGRDYLYAQGVVVGDFIKVNIQGDPVVNIRQCQRPWVNGQDLIDAGETPEIGYGIYLCNEYNSIDLEWQTQDVSHNGAIWRCLQHQPVTIGGVDTYYEPTWGSPYWQFVQGDNTYTMEFVSTNGNAFYVGSLSTTLTPYVYFGAIDISTIEGAISTWKWERESESGKTDADRIWDAGHTNVRVLQLSDVDMPTGWGRNNRAIFTCTATIVDGQNQIIVQNQIVA